jgi:predicted small secreted protein
MQEVSLKGPVEYIKESFKIYFKKENMIFFIKVMSLAVIFSTIISLTTNYLKGSTPNYSSDLLLSKTFVIISYVMLVLSFFVYFWMQSSTYLSILNIGSNESEVIKKSLRKLPLLIGVNMILGIITLFGFVLLIIPAVIFGVWYSFTIFLMLDKNISFKKAMKVSKQLVKGKFMKVFGRYIVFGIFSMVINIIFTILPYAGSILIGLMMPLLLLPSYLMYKDITSNFNID